MRVRPLSPLGDMTIGQPWLVNSPECVAQIIGTRLKLWLGEWFLDTSDGTPWLTEILGERYNRNPDAAIKRRILATPGVTSLAAYTSSFDGTTRTLTINAVVNTQFSGTVTLSNVQISAPSSGGGSSPLLALTTESGVILTTESGTPLIA